MRTQQSSERESDCRNCHTGTLRHTLKIIKDSQTYYKNLREPSDVFETTFIFLGYSRRISQDEATDAYTYG